MNYSFPLTLSRSVNDLRTGTVDLEDYLLRILDRIDQVDPVIHALIPEQGRRERVMMEAHKLKEKYPDPEMRPALFGIPIGVKDIFRVNGFPTKAGSQLPDDLFSGDESSVVSTLRNAGAIILGKTVTTEFAYFEPGPTCNPVNPLHTPGGSSSGSAASVACGFTPMALGTQTIGSISRPASFCGVFGFKPGFGRIPTDGVIPFSVSADHVGFFTQDLEGIEMIAGLLLKDWNKNIEFPDRKPHIGIITGKYLAQTDDEISELFRKKVCELKQSGFKIIETDLFGEIEKINTEHKKLVAGDFFRVHEHWFAEYEELYRQGTKKLILEGKIVDNGALEFFRQSGFSLRKKTEESGRKNGIDLWLSPSACTPPPYGLGSTGSPLMNLPWTFMGMPTIAVPSGTTFKGLPFGLQFAGYFMKDEFLMGWVKKILEAMI